MRRFGSWDEPLVAKAAEAQMKRTGRDPHRQWAVGDREDILARLGDFVDAGISKFILRPMGRDDDEIMAQTRRIVEEVIPAAEAMRGQQAAA